jgi:hypothetical protein
VQTQTGVQQLGVQARPGTPVEVRARFDAAWKRGFELVSWSDGTVRVRRLSDGAVLPELPAEDVRPVR